MTSIPNAHLFRDRMRCCRMGSRQKSRVSISFCTIADGLSLRLTHSICVHIVSSGGQHFVCQSSARRSEPFSPNAMKIDYNALC
ncbi:hypothetical protein I7I48_04450 [Histoplasma ohiense]|nr:hypothetical protein I7I48_04450 [Histoplasma ohiense (nom. inval.)]